MRDALGCQFRLKMSPKVQESRKSNNSVTKSELPVRYYNSTEAAAKPRYVMSPEKSGFPHNFNHFRASITSYVPLKYKIG